MPNPMEISWNKQFSVSKFENNKVPVNCYFLKLEAEIKKVFFSCKSIILVTLLSFTSVTSTKLWKLTVA